MHPVEVRTLPKALELVIGIARAKGCGYFLTTRQRRGAASGLAGA